MKVSNPIFLLLLLLIAYGCAGPQRTGESQFPETGTHGTPESQQVTDESLSPKVPIPPDCPLAKIRKGMGTRQVMDILGPPTDQDSYVTGKMFIPFYFGSDSSRMVLYYKKLGKIYFTGGGPFGGGGRVIKIMYDPTEDGYR